MAVSWPHRRWAKSFCKKLWGEANPSADLYVSGIIEWGGGEIGQIYVKKDRQ